MIQYKKKFGIFTTSEIWFDYHFLLSDLFSFKRFLDIKNQDVKKIPAVKNTTYTVVLSINEEEQTIFNNFRTSIQQEIRKSKNDGVVCEVNNNKIDEFVNFYNEFAKAKGIYTTNTQRIKEMGSSFCMTFATLNEETLVAHSYLVDKSNKIARLFHSASKRLEGQVDKNLISRANKLLTFEDIIHFKKVGIEVLDFGGYAKDTDDKSLKGINEFKLSFGGAVVACNDYDTWMYFIVRAVFNFIKRKK
jgi:lipid II:glycine glycyltransferase (peptidoglycan interpeptide bridge formation enzyme)